MKSNLISKENNIATFTMDFTAEEFEQAIIRAYQQNKDKFNIDGFRKGKAPRSIIERYYGEGVFFEDAINELFQTHYSEALKELALEVVDMPKADFSEIGKGKPVTMTFEVPLYPVVEVKDYLGIEIDERIADVSDDDVDVQLEMLQKRNSRLVVADRPAEDGDTVILDYAGFVGDEQFEGGTAENQELVLGSGRFIPGFEEQLVGAKAGDKVDVKVTFPEEYHAENLAGKEAVFHCTVHEIKFEELPELDDEFVKDVSEFDTMEELRKDTYDRIKESRELMVQNEAKDALVEKITEANPIEVPQAMARDEADHMVKELEQQMMYQGMSVDMYMQFLGKDIEGLKAEMLPEAEKRVASRILLRSIAQQEGWEVTDEDVEKEIHRMAELYQMEDEQVKSIFAGDNLDYFKKDIIITKTINKLYENAKINKVESVVKTNVGEDKEEKEEE